MMRSVALFTGMLALVGLTASTFADSGGATTASSPACCFQMGAFCEVTKAGGGSYDATACRNAGGLAYADTTTQCDLFCGAPPVVPPRNGGETGGGVALPPLFPPSNPPPGQTGDATPPFNPFGGVNAGNPPNGGAIGIGIPPLNPFGGMNAGNPPGNTSGNPGSLPPITPPGSGGGNDTGGGGGGDVEQIWCCQGVQWFESDVLDCVQGGGIIFTGTRPPPPPAEWLCGLPVVRANEQSQCALCGNDVYTPCTQQRCTQLQGTTPCRYLPGPPARCVGG